MQIFKTKEGPIYALCKYNADYINLDMFNATDVSKLSDENAYDTSFLHAFKRWGDEQGIVSDYFRALKSHLKCKSIVVLPGKNHKYTKLQQLLGSFEINRNKSLTKEQFIDSLNNPNKYINTLNIDISTKKQPILLVTDTITSTKQLSFYKEILKADIEIACLGICLKIPCNELEIDDNYHKYEMECFKEDVSKYKSNKNKNYTLER